MITIFSTPRPFAGEFEAIQYRAIKSWKKFLPNAQIILINDEENTSIDIANEFKIECITNASINEFGTPLLGDVFKKVKEMSLYNIIVHINTDILITDKFGDCLTNFHNKFVGDYLLLGRRWNINAQNLADVDDPRFIDQLNKFKLVIENLHGYSGMDYWVFPKSTRINPPDFCVGRPGMDSWLVYNAKKINIPVIDATALIDIFHQNHGYPKLKLPYFEIECERNIALAGGRDKMLTLREADLLLTEDYQLSSPNLFRRALGFLSQFQLWMTALKYKRMVQRLIHGSSR